MLEQRGVSYRARDFFKDRFTRDELAALLARAGLRPRDVLATRSRAYRDLGLAGRQVSDDELLDLMVAEPTLLRRPIVVTDHEVIVGFDARRLEALVERGSQRAET
mgnify:FL=1